MRPGERWLTPSIDKSVKADQWHRIARPDTLCQPRTPSRLFLHPELVHPGKGVRLLALEVVPGREVGHGPVVREPRQVSLRREMIEIEADKRKAIFRNEAGYLRNRQAVFL